MGTTISETLLGKSTTAAETTSSSILGKDDFLKLLITQLQYQDPMNPLDGTEFAAQLAQFSSVEQLANLNETLSASITTNQIMAQSIGNALASSMIGKDVKASGDTVQWTGDRDVRFGYTLAADAATVTVKVYDANGELVRTITEKGAAAGDTTLAWDGTNDAGAAVPAGSYKISVEAVDGAGAAVTASAFLYGTVEGVRFKSTGTVFVVDGMEIPLSAILEILNGSTHG